MSADAQDSVNGAMAGGVASNATLVATFYGPRDDKRTDLLYKRLDQSLSGPPKTLLECFKPPGGAARDTVAIQLTVKIPGEVTKAWKDARQTLESILSDGTALKATWGHTLIYQAELTEGVDPDSALEELLPAIRRLHSSEDLHPLAVVNVLRGRLWLLSIPDRGEGLEAATVYAALSPPEEAEALQDMFYGPVAMLLEPDLIAHKGYYQMRQYRGDDLEKMYEESADSLRQTTSDLLEGLSSDAPETDKLNELADKYRLLFPVVGHLSELRTALVKQKHNYERASKTRAGGGKVFEFHREHLETAALELKLEVEELQHALETADKVVSIARLKVDEVQERTQLRIEATLAAAGVALALPHLLEPNTVAALLGWLPCGIEISHTKNGLLTESGHRIVLFAQLAIIVPIAILTYRLVRRSGHKVRGFH